MLGSRAPTRVCPLLCLIAFAAAQTALGLKPCPSSSPILSADAVPWANTTWMVCESHLPGSPVLFVPEDPMVAAIWIERSAVPLYTTPTWLNLTEGSVKSSVADSLGNLLLDRGGDPSFAEIRSALAPLVYDGGYEAKDPAHGGRTARPGVHTFVGSRGSSADICFDSLGSDVNSEGHPSMNQFNGKYGRSAAVFKDHLNQTGQLEGLWGGYLPIVSYWFERVEGGYIGFTAVPKADMEGSMEQDAFFRIQRIDGNGTLMRAQYYDNYVYTAGAFQSPDQVPASGEPPNSMIANDFYAAVLEQQRWWKNELASEGVAQMSLPADQETDGQTMAKQAIHSIIRDMITRRNHFFPKYGVLPSNYAFPEANGFAETFWGTMTMALEVGAFEYATGVIQNWLKYYVRRNGTTTYNHVGMTALGRELTVYAQYYRYTGDPLGLIPQYFERIQGRTWMLIARREQALRLDPSSSGYGMLTGDDNEDLGASEIECGTTHPDGHLGDCQTELPYISITAEAARGFYELGPVYQEVGAKLGRKDIADAGQMMSNLAGSMRTDLDKSIERSAVPPPPGSNLTCHPHVATWSACFYGGDPKSFHPYGPNVSYTYPTLDVLGGGFTWPGVMFSGMIQPQVARDIVEFGSQYGAWTMIAPRKPGTLPFYCPFAQLGHGYGMLLFDMTERFLVFAFAMGAHAYTPGTWTAAECSGYDRSAAGSGYVAPSQTLWPTLLKWMLHWEDPFTKSVWIGRALPRAWLRPGHNVTLTQSPSSYGRLSFVLLAVNDSTVTVNITLPAGALQNRSFGRQSGGYTWPAGGIKVRLRHPSKTMQHVTLAGAPFSSFNATDETVWFENMPQDASALQLISVFFG